MNITIIGNGRFRNYIGDQLSKNKASVSLIDIPKNKTEQAQQGEIITNSNALLYCVPIRNFKETILAHKEFFSKKALIMDTCSVMESTLSKKLVRKEKSPVSTKQKPNTSFPSPGYTKQCRKELQEIGLIQSQKTLT